MSFRVGGGGGDGREEPFETTGAVVSGGESDDEDRLSDGGAGDQGRHRLSVPQPLRRMNSDGIYDMTAQLPASRRKGLSRYYEGRSQSFACMSEVRCLEDLQKKDNNTYKQEVSWPYKSYGAPRGMAQTTKPSSHSCANLSIVAASGFMAPAPQIHVSKNGYHQ